MPTIHRGASEPTKFPPAQHITYHNLFMMAFGLLLMLPRAIELVETNPLILVIIILHLCKKQLVSKRRCPGQGTASTDNLGTNKLSNQSNNGVKLSTSVSWSELLLFGHFFTLSLYIRRLASSSSTATSIANTTTTEISASTAPLLEAGESLGDELQKFTTLDKPVASSTGYFCITEVSFDNASAKEIALNVTQHSGTNDIYIYRFTPGSIITVTINWHSFGALNLSDHQKANFRDHLERAIGTIRTANLGIQFRLVPDEHLDPHMRGVIDVRYGGQGRLPHSGTIGWARARFPQPNKQRYTLEVYSTTFEQEFHDCIYNIMLHELGHFMNMRHHPGVQRSDWRNEVLRLLLPAGDSNTNSIMGDWNNLQDLELSETDISHCRQFYSFRAGLYSYPDHDTGCIHNLWLEDVPVHNGLIPRIYN